MANLSPAEREYLTNPRKFDKNPNLAYQIRHRIKKKYIEMIKEAQFIESHADSKFLKKLMDARNE